MNVQNEDRRRHHRFELTCPIALTDSKGTVLLRTRTLNISDGGAMLQGDEEMIDIGESVGVGLRLPRSTPNTFMYEEIASRACVVRHEPSPEGSAMALMFIEPLSLDLEA